MLGCYYLVVLVRRSVSVPAQGHGSWECMCQGVDASVQLLRKPLSLSTSDDKATHHIKGPIQYHGVQGCLGGAPLGRHALHPLVLLAQTLLQKT